MPYFCVTPHVLNKYAMIFWVEKQINLALDGPLPTCGRNRVSVPMCEHQHESQDTRHPIGFGLSCCLRNFMLWFCSMGNAIHGLGFTTLDKIKNIIILLFEINKFIMSIIALLTILLLL
jgi:hypothetical protein